MLKCGRANSSRLSVTRACKALFAVNNPFMHNGGSKYDVRRRPEGHISIVVPLSGSNERKTLERNAHEPVSKALARLRRAVSSTLGLDDAEVVLLADATGTPMEANLPNEQAWTEAYALKIGDRSLLFPRVDAPTVEAVHCIQRPLIGQPIVAVPLGVENQKNGSLDFSWLSSEAETPIEKGTTFRPLPEHEGTRLLVECKAVDNADEVCSNPIRQYLRWPVETPPERPHALARARSIGPKQPGDIRLVSYNVLADTYRSAWHVLFPYIADHHKEPDYRLQLAFEELDVMNPDIAALQEVDNGWFDKFWHPRARLSGYEAIHTPKVGGAAEGCALLFKDSDFHLRHFESLNLSSGVVESPSKHVQEYLRLNPWVAEAARSVTTVAQIAILERRESPQEKLCVTNTHLYFHPEAGALRILQANTLLRRAGELAREESASLVMMGDFNAESSDGVVRYLLGNRVSASFWEWTNSSFFRWSGEGARSYSAALAQEVQTPEPEKNAALGDPDVVTSEERVNLLRRLETSLATCSTGATCGQFDSEEGERADSDPNEAHQFARRHAKRQCTYKGCPVVAGYALNRDLGQLKIGLTPKDGATVSEAVHMLREMAQGDFDTALGEQNRLCDNAGSLPEDQDERALGCGMDLRHSFRFDCASGANLPFTNYVRGFKAALDHIIVDGQSLKPVRDLDPLSEEAASQETALPSSQFPSDHIALCADVRPAFAQPSE